MLTPRWTPLKPHPEQTRLLKSTARFKTVPAGRRSGKTEIVGKRITVIKAMKAHAEVKYPPPYNFGVGAPTRDQAKRIYWTDLKQMVPRNFLIKDPNESNLTLELINGARICVIGMDRPERIEGSPWDGFTLDEYANMKKKTWTEHLRPALSDRLGWANFIGVPEGRNHYYELDKSAQARRHDGVWDSFSWPSSDILPQSEIDAAKEDLDELTFQQEYEGSFINFQGRAYYGFNDRTHCDRLYADYDPDQPLILCFDFNVSPGVAAVAQEMPLYDAQTNVRLINQTITCWIGEVYIPRNSNTPLVCNRLIKDWGEHRGRVVCYGDSTGGSKGSAKVMGSDWDLIKQTLHPHFGDRLQFKVSTTNPPERDRINAVNSRFKNIFGDIRMMVDPDRCPHLVRDFEGVSVVEGGSGELDKKSSPELTHISDAAGYYVEREFPVKARKTTVQEI